MRLKVEGRRPYIPPLSRVRQNSKCDGVHNMATSGPSRPPPSDWLWPFETQPIQVEVEFEGAARWVPATVISVHTDSTFSAEITTPDGDSWVDWFTWEDENTDWRRKAGCLQGVRLDQSAPVINGKRKDAHQGANAASAGCPTAEVRKAKEDGRAAAKVATARIAGLACDGVRHGAKEAQFVAKQAAKEEAKLARTAATGRAKVAKQAAKEAVKEAAKLARAIEKRDVTKLKAEDANGNEVELRLRLDRSHAPLVLSKKRRRELEEERAAKAEEAAQELADRKSVV